MNYCGSFCACAYILFLLIGPIMLLSWGSLLTRSSFKSANVCSESLRLEHILLYVYLINFTFTIWSSSLLLQAARNAGLTWKRKTLCWERWRWGWGRHQACGPPTPPYCWGPVAWAPHGLCGWHACLWTQLQYVNMLRMRHNCWYCNWSVCCYHVAMRATWKACLSVKTAMLRIRHNSLYYNFRVYYVANWSRCVAHLSISV